MFARTTLERNALFSPAPRLQDLHERSAAKLGRCQPALLDRFVLGDRAAVHRPQEIIQETLSGGGIVEHVANQGGLRGLLHEVLEPLGSRVEPFEEERVHRRIARRQLRRMQVPPLVETGDERVAHVLGMQRDPIGMRLVAPYDNQMPVPASATCITCFAKSQTGWSMCWCAAVMLQAAV